MAKAKPKSKLKPKAKAEPKHETPAEPKRIVHLPVPHECPPDVVIVPKKIDPALIVPLVETPPPVRCYATLVKGWLGWGDSIVLSAAPGHQLPPISETGTEVTVQFSPPALPSAPVASVPVPDEPPYSERGVAG